MGDTDPNETAMADHCYECGESDPDFIMPLDNGRWICMDCYGTEIGCDDDLVEEVPF